MKKLLQSLLVIMAIVGFCSPGVRAEVFPTDGSAIKLGEVYDVEFGKDYKATLTITETGVLVQDGCPEILITDIEDTNRLDIGWGIYGQIFGWKVEAGKTYTLETNFVMNNGKVCFEMESTKGLTLLSISPEEGGVLAPNNSGTGTIDLTFGSSVTFDKAYLKAGDVQEQLYTIPAPENILALGVKAAMNKMYASGALNVDGGTPVTLKIEGLKTQSGILYNGDGIMEKQFVASPKPVDMVSSKIPSTFKSYYPEGDSEGILEFVFDRDLIDNGTIVLSIFCGNPEADPYVEEIPALIDGAKATIDLCGEFRDLNSYLTADGNVLLTLVGVKDINGLIAAGSGEGSYGSYSYQLPYQYLTPVNLVSEFTPASGESLQGVKNVEIWFNNADAISFDGVKITYDDNGELKTIILSESQLSIDRSGNDVTITFDVPAELQGKSKITVSLNNVSSKDGQDYNIVAQYDQFVAKLLSPVKPGEVIASTGDDDFVFDLNIDNTILYVRYDFYNGEEEGDWAGGAQLNKQENGTYTAYNHNYKCYSDFDPFMIVSAYYNENDYWQGITAAGTYRIDFKGTTKPFEFSSVKFVDIDPANNSIIEPSEDFCWTVKFDGLVSIDTEASGVLGSGGLVPFKKVEPVVPEEGLGNTWRLYPVDGFWGEQQAIDINIVAYDMDNLLVEGNTGFQQYSSLQFSYEVHAESSLKELTVTPAAGSIVEELSEFVISFDNMAVGPNYSYTGEHKVAIYTLASELVYEFGADDIEVVSEQTGVDEVGQPIYDPITKVILKVDPVITDPETYVLIIPENYFIIGAEFETYGNLRFTGTYYIDSEPKAPVQLTVTPEGGDVSELTLIEINAPGIEDAKCFGEENITITNAEGEIVYTATSAELLESSFDWDTFTFLGFFLEPNITDQGVYTLHIPAEFFEFLDGSTSAALEVVYTITTSGITSVGVEKAESYTVYTVSGVLVLKSADVNSLSTLAPGIYVINGKKVLVK